MDIRNELQWIAANQNSLLPRQDRHDEKYLKEKVEEAHKAYEQGDVDFRQYCRMLLKQDAELNEDKRIVRMFVPFSPQHLLSIYLKETLDRRFRVTFPNRNTYVRSLFNTIYALKDMSDFTIFKFDFADFFNSVSSVFVYEKYIQGAGFERFQDDLLKKYVDMTRYAYAGLCTSNILCEIAAQHFDDLLNQGAIGKGLIFYRRYIDDGIMVFNRFISKEDCLDLVNQAIIKTFYDNTCNGPRCKTALNDIKTKHIARRLLSLGSEPAQFDFLGYEFKIGITDKKNPKDIEIPNGKKKGNNQSGKNQQSGNGVPNADIEEMMVIKYGITDKKIRKYTKRVNDIVKKYAEDSNPNIELLRHQLKAFTHRIVYRSDESSGAIWINKGFLANYSELRYHMNELTRDTDIFLKNVIKRAISANKVKYPYFLGSKKKGYDEESIYTLYNNMKKYKTLLFVEGIGIDYKTLRKMCAQVGIVPGAYKEYEDLLRAYLNKVGIGY